MKPLLIIVFFTFFSSFLFAQDETLRNNSAQSVEEVDAYITAIETKITMVKSDSVQHQKALNSGWYLQMAQNIRAAKRQRKILLGEAKEENSTPTNNSPKNSNY